MHTSVENISMRCWVPWTILAQLKPTAVGQSLVHCFNAALWQVFQGVRGSFPSFRSTFSLHSTVTLSLLGVSAGDQEVE